MLPVDCLIAAADVLTSMFAWLRQSSMLSRLGTEAATNMQKVDIMLAHQLQHREVRCVTVGYITAILLQYLCAASSRCERHKCHMINPFQAPVIPWLMP